MRRFVPAPLLVAVLLSGCSSAPPPAPVEEKAAAPAALGSIVRSDPALDALIPASAAIEKVADGFDFIEGPLWRPAGSLWFSDVTGNVVRQWTPGGQIVEILRPGGYDKNDAPAGSYIGPNGMTADKDGAVLLCQHGNRRIVRIDKDRKVTTLVDKHDGKRLNSPNDLVYRSDGSLYFTDPPYGLLKQDEDPAKELPYNGVYRLANGKTQLLVKDMSRPNGIGFSPDEKTLYVANCDTKAIWMRYDVAANGTVGAGRVFFDASGSKEEGCPDGLKIDEKGNVYATGPGGVWVFSPEGKHLGTIKAPEIPANVGWGDDGKSLYMTARKGLYRIKLAVDGSKSLYQ